MAFLSIIVPFYNKYNFINRGIHSIINQDFQDIEIIIVDEAHHLEGFDKETKWRTSLKNINTSKYLLLSATLEDEDVDVDYDIQFGIKNKYLTACNQCFNTRV